MAENDSKNIAENVTKNSEPKYPEIVVQLTGKDGNAFFILGTVRKALKKAGVNSNEIDEWLKESTSGDYDNLLVTQMRWVTVL